MPRGIYERQSVEQRFWSKVNKTDTCWLWMGNTIQSGYALFKINKTMQLAHRVSWTLNCGPIPNGLCVLHKCDNPICVRPEHLFLGTQHDNMIDMVNKGRGVDNRGIKCGTHKLTERQTKFIKCYPKYFGSGKQLAKQFNVCVATISMIRNNKRWKHILHPTIAIHTN